MIAIRAEIMSPAIIVRGQKGVSDGEAERVRTGEGVAVTGTLSDGVEIGKGCAAETDSLDATTVMLVLKTFFTEGLVTLTKYFPGYRSARNP